MADNLTTQSSTAATVPASSVIATDDVSGVHFQKMKLDVGADGVSAPLSTSNPVPVSPVGCSTATLANVSSSGTSSTLLAANAARRGAIFYNDSAQACYVKFGATASATSFTYLMIAGSTLEVPFGFTGLMAGIWVSADGAMRVTELT